MERAPHQPLFSQAPLAHLALAFSTGIVLAHYLTVPFVVLIPCGSLLSIVALLALTKQNLPVSAACLIAAMLFAGAIIGKNENRNPPQNRLKQLLDAGVVPLNDPVEVTGAVEGTIDFTFDRVYFTVRLEQLRYKGVETIVSGTVAVTTSLSTSATVQEYTRLNLHYGTRLRLITTLRRADRYRNPGVPLFTEYLDRKGFDATGFVKSPLLIERLADKRVFLPLSWLYQWRQKMQQEIDRLFSRSTAGVLDAALLGNRYNLSPATAERFRAGGTFHVLVISGLHISFIGGVVFLFAQKLTRRRGVQFVLATVVLWGYALAVGAEASVLRAALMFTMVALAPLIFRKASSLNAVGGTALVLLLWQPRSLFDPSFQLTFLSVLAIVLVAWPLLQRIAAIGSWQPTHNSPYPPACPRRLRTFCESLFWSERRWQRESAHSVHRCRLFKSPIAARLEGCHLQRAARYTFSALVVSSSVQIVLLPFLIIYFHRVSLASLVLNIGVSLIMAALAFVSLSALLVAQLSEAVAGPLISLANGLNWLMVHSVDPFARIGIASVRLPHYSGPAGVVYWLYYLPLGMLAVALRRWNPLALPTPPGTHAVNKQTFIVLAQILLISLIVIHPFSSGRPDGRLRIDFLDVGQGDSALVTMPDGSTLLIDGGGRPAFASLAPVANADSESRFGRDARSIGEAVVSEYLWWRGLDSIDYVLATHADADHIDGLSDVVRNFHVRAALIGRAPARDPEFQIFAGTLSAQKVPFYLIGAGDVLRFGAVTAEVLWPLPNESSKAASGNNDSVALRLELGAHQVLMTGDIEGAAEKAILKTRPTLNVEVVKVAHHGSKTSSTSAFVDATRPVLVVISVGQTSMFGHPSREVVDRWEESGANVLTTGNCGTITITTNGRELQLQTFVHD